MIQILLRFGQLVMVALVVFTLLFVVGVLTKNPFAVLLLISVLSILAYLDARSTYSG